MFLPLYNVGGCIFNVGLPAAGNRTHKTLPGFKCKLENWTSTKQKQIVKEMEMHFYFNFLEMGSLELKLSCFYFISLFSEKIPDY